MRILIADDHVLFRKVTIAMLERLEIGDQILESYNREHAQYILNEDGITHVLINYRYLPIVTTAKVIVVSSFNRETHYPFLRKPVSMEMLKNVLDT